MNTNDTEASAATLDTQLIRMAQSCAGDARSAAAELHAGLTQPGLALVVFFCSSHYDLAELSVELNRLFGSVPVVGCTTAGEIGPLGYADHGISGLSFPAAHFTAVIGQLQQLQDFTLDQSQSLAQALLQRIEALQPRATADNTFALLLIDGLSRREELVADALQHAFGKRLLLGGSAGDDLAFSRTQVYFDGHFEDDAAVVVLLTTRVPFQVFKTQHFQTTPERLVVTGADSARRIVTEINGLPAAEEYARLIGVSVDDLTPLRFAAAPIVVVIDGTDYVRAIQRANADGSLTFYCAIDEGLVLRVAQGIDLVANLEKTFARLRDELGPLQAVLTCDCILRNLEITQRGTKPRVAEVFRRNSAIGFSTYGEQYAGVHVNQTLTGVAFGMPAGNSHV